MKKRVLAMFLAATMAMAMPCMAFAEEATATEATASKETYNMSFEEKGKVAHNYKVYQIFSGTLAEGETENKNILSDIEWGSSVKDGSVTVDGKKYTDASEFAKYLKDLNDAQLEGIRGQIADSLDKDKAVTEFTSVAGSKVDVKLSAGYYLIEDVTPDEKLIDTATNTKDTKSSYVIHLVGNVEVAAKVGSVTSEKKVDDINDSVSGSEELLQDTADYDIGDDVPFTITGTLPANYNKYSTFYYSFHDKMEQGLTYNDDVEVFIDGEKITSGYVVNSSADMKEFTVTFENLKNSTTYYLKVEVKDNKGNT